MDANGTATAVGAGSPAASGSRPPRARGRVVGACRTSCRAPRRAPTSRRSPVDPDGQALRHGSRPTGPTCRPRRAPAGRRRVAGDRRPTLGHWPERTLSRGDPRPRGECDGRLEPLERHRAGLQAAHASPSGAWSTPVDVAAGGTDVYATRLSANPNGDLALSWRRDNGLAAAVGSCPPPAPPPPPPRRRPRPSRSTSRAPGPSIRARSQPPPRWERSARSTRPWDASRSPRTPGRVLTDVQFTGANAAGTSPPATVTSRSHPSRPPPRRRAPAPAPARLRSSPWPSVQHPSPTPPLDEDVGPSRRLFRIRLRAPRACV